MGRPQAVWAEVTVDCRDTERVAAFWSALLDAPAKAGPNGWFELGPLVEGGPKINFQRVPEDKVGKARVHLDIWVDDLDAAIAVVEKLGGRNTGEVHEESDGIDVVMTDPEGTEFCLVALAAR